MPRKEIDTQPGGKQPPKSKADRANETRPSKGRRSDRGLVPGLESPGHPARERPPNRQRLEAELDSEVGSRNETSSMETEDEEKEKEDKRKRKRPTAPVTKAEEEDMRAAARRSRTEQEEEPPQGA